MVYIKTYLFNHFYQQHLVLSTMVPRNSVVPRSATIHHHPSYARFKGSLRKGLEKQESP